MNTVDRLHDRLTKLENKVNKPVTIFTVPVYNLSSPPPQDGAEAQIVLMEGVGFYAFLDGSWWQFGGFSGITYAGGPQDPVEGEIALNLQNQLCFYLEGVWDAITGIPTVDYNSSFPLDPIPGQIVIGSGNTLCWHGFDGIWYCILGVGG